MPAVRRIRTSGRPPVEALDEDEADELSEVDPPPSTVSPTWSLTAVTVPPMGATSVVSSTVFWSSVTVCWAVRIWLSSWRIVDDTGACPASDAAMLCSSALTVPSSRATVCWSVVTTCCSVTHELCAVVNATPRPVADPRLLVATTRKM